METKEEKQERKKEAGRRKKEKGVVEVGLTVT